MKQLESGQRKATGHDRMADEGIAKIRSWMDRMGIDRNELTIWQNHGDSAKGDPDISINGPACGLPKLWLDFKTPNDGPSSTQSIRWAQIESRGDWVRIVRHPDDALVIIGCWMQTWPESVRDGLKHTKRGVDGSV